VTTNPSTESAARRLPNQEPGDAVARQQAILAQWLRANPAPDPRGLPKRDDARIRNLREALASEGLGAIPGPLDKFRTLRVVRVADLLDDPEMDPPYPG
jgi:hypothetical protein